MTLQTHPQTREMVFDLEHFFRSHIFKTTLYLDCFFMRPFPLKVGRQAHPQSIFHARLSCSPWKMQRFPENLKKFKWGSKRWNNWNKLKQPENSWTTWRGHTFFVCCLCLLCFVLFFQHSPTFSTFFTLFQVFSTVSIVFKIPEKSGSTLTFIRQIRHSLTKS